MDTILSPKYNSKGRINRSSHYETVYVMSIPSDVSVDLNIKLKGMNLYFNSLLTYIRNCSSKSREDDTLYADKSGF